MLNVAAGKPLVTDVAIDARMGRGITIADRPSVQPPLARQFDQACGVAESEFQRPERAVAGFNLLVCGGVDGQNTVARIDHV
ncbi:hypothetical protein D3C78_1725650 [compost metagenome]